MFSQDDVYSFVNFFSEKEVDNFCERHQTNKDIDWVDAEITGDISYDPTIRKTKLKSLRHNRNDLFITKFVYGIVQANERKFKKNINTYFLENITLLKYSKDNDFFRIHCDSGEDDRTSARQLSAIVPLSNTNEYEGGGLVFYGNKECENRFRLHTAKGSLIVFPSKMFHEVTPVTSGTRLSLVMWVG